MPMFTDNKGRDWQLTIDVAAMRRARKVDIDLSQPFAQLQQFVMDDVFVCDALWAIIQPQASGIKQDDFDSAMGGKEIAEARDALWAALEEYYDPKKAEMLRTALQSVEREMQQALADISDGSTDAKES